MRKLFVAAIVLGLFAVTPAAFAQSEHGQDGNSNHHAKSNEASKSGKGNKSDTGNKSDKGRQSGQRGVSDTAQSQYQTRTRSAHKAARTHNATADNRMRNADTSRTFGTISPRRPANVLAMRRNVQASHHFQAAAYREPHGYSRRHWNYGERLPSAYYVRDYWLTDYLMYSLFAPPDGLVWVRVGDDALLIDEYSGEIIQVDYGVFA